MDNKNKKKFVMEKASTLSNMASFDPIFWKKVGAQARFSATWSTIKDYYKIRGKHGNKLRLQRSVQNIKQA